MKTIYTAVINRLIDQVPALKWIDMDIGQLDSQERPAIALPCCLITISIPNPKAISDTFQECDARIGLKLIFDIPERTNSVATEANRLAGLANYDIIAATYAALQGYETENFDSLNRTSQGPGAVKRGLWIYPMDFTARFEDATAE